MDYIKYLRSMVGHKPVIMAVAGVAIFDHENRLLMHHRKVDNLWGLIGGFMELGETVEQAARREVREEVALELGNLELVGVFDNPLNTLPNGDQVQAVISLFATNEYSGKPRVADNEGLEVKFFKLDELPPREKLKLPWVIEAVVEKYSK